MQKSKRVSTRQPEALAMLTKDHRAAQKLFKQFDKLEDSDEKRRLVRHTCDELRAHSRLEEELFYPAVRRALKERERDVESIAEAEVEHGVVADLIEKLTRMTGTDDEHFDAAFHVLAETVNHHIEEEEGKIFRELLRAKTDLGALAQEMGQRKDALREEMGLEEAGETESAKAHAEEAEHDESRHRTR